MEVIYMGRLKGKKNSYFSEKNLERHSKQAISVVNNT